MECQNLAKIRANQDCYRSDLYQGLVDAAAVDEDMSARQVGVRTVLPTSFEGGPRKMRELFQVCAFLGCNPLPRYKQYHCIAYLVG